MAWNMHAYNLGAYFAPYVFGISHTSHISIFLLLFSPQFYSIPTSNQKLDWFSVQIFIHSFIYHFIYFILRLCFNPSSSLSSHTFLSFESTYFIYSTFVTKLSLLNNFLITSFRKGRQTVYKLDIIKFKVTELGVSSMNYWWNAILVYNIIVW